MSHEKTTRMANQIATFFKSQPQDTQVAGVANHINEFWEPRMRNEFFAMLDSGQTDGFDQIVIDAAEFIRRPAAA